MQTAMQALPSMSNPAPSTEVGAVPDSWIERIFARLSAQLGAKIADLWQGVPPEQVKAEWAEALAHFDRTEIARGLQACQSRQFAPTLGEFLRLCRPALDPEIAWLEAQACMRQRDAGEIGDWTHPGVYRAARDMQHEIRTGSFRENRKRWEWLLWRELQRGWLMAIPKPAPALAHSDAPVRGPTEEERRKLAELRGSFPKLNPGSAFEEGGRA